MSVAMIGISKGRGELKGEERYIRAIEEAGGKAVILPPGKGEIIHKLNGLLLPGGGDVKPCFYGEVEQGSESIDEERDKWEIELARSFFKEGKSILGICRGAQVLNVSLGGTLHQDIKGHREGRHLIKIEEESLLSDILEGIKEIEVDSSHHQAVKEVAPSLKEDARSGDGIIEGIEGEGFILGVQFHPERIYKEQPIIFNIFKKFVRASKREIYTLGTSTRNWEEFIEILKAYDVEEVVDVRRFPLSRLEWFRKEELEKRLRGEGLFYIWMGEGLGGYRSPSYQAYTRTEEFGESLKKLSQRALRKRVVIICAEALPWRCHRRFIASAMEERGWKVTHIISKGKEWCPTERVHPEDDLFSEDV